MKANSLEAVSCRVGRSRLQAARPTPLGLAELW